MLKKFEQEAVFDLVREIVRNDRTRQTRLRRQEMSRKSADEGYARDLRVLADMLKELG